MAKAKKLPSGTWRVQVYVGMVDGKRKYISICGSTKIEAEYKAAEYTLKKKNARDHANITVRDAIDLYVSSKSGDLSPSTVDGYGAIRRNAFADIMDIALKDLTDNVMQQAINIEKKKVQPKTVCNRYALLKTAISDIMPDFDLKIKLPKINKKKISIPSNKDLAVLLEYAKGRPLELPIMLACFMGLRRSEICALTWDDYDEKTKTITINKASVLTETNVYVEKSPKTNAGNRTITVPDPVAQVIKNKDKSLPLIGMTPTVLSSKYNRALKVIKKHIRFHALRHYYASMLLSIGVPDKYAMELMGHATVDMLKSVYQHTMKEKLKEADFSINQTVLQFMQHEMQHEMQHDSPKNQ